MSEPKPRYVNIYKDDPTGRFISDIDYESVEQLESVMEYRIDKEFVVETVRLLSLEEDKEIREALAEQEKQMPSETDLEFVVDVMDSLRDYPSVLTDAVDNERRAIVKRYDGLKSDMSFQAASRMARAEWLLYWLRSRIESKKEV